MAQFTVFNVSYTREELESLLNRALPRREASFKHLFDAFETGISNGSMTVHECSLALQGFIRGNVHRLEEDPFNVPRDYTDIVIDMVNDRLEIDGKTDLIKGSRRGRR